MTFSFKINVQIIVKKLKKLRFSDKYQGFLMKIGGILFKKYNNDDQKYPGLCNYSGRAVTRLTAYRAIEVGIFDWHFWWVCEQSSYNCRGFLLARITIHSGMLCASKGREPFRNFDWHFWCVCEQSTMVSSWNFLRNW